MNKSKNIYGAGFAVLVVTICITIMAGSAEAEELTAFEGIIEPYELVSVGTPVEGLVETVNVQRSAVVKKGQPLIELESSVERAGVERARAKAVIDGDIQLEKERLAYALRTYSRIEELITTKAVSAEEADKAATEVAMARARLQKAQEHRELARLDVVHAEALRDLRTIRSPISGIVVERFVGPGEFVAEQPLLKLAQIDPLRVEVILPAEMLKKITPGMKAEVEPENHDGVLYTATVVIVDRVIDPATGTFGVRLELPNPDYNLTSGFKCMVRFADEGEAMAETSRENNDRKTTMHSESQSESLLTNVIHARRDIAILP